MLCSGFEGCPVSLLVVVVVCIVEIKVKSEHVRYRRIAPTGYTCVISVTGVSRVNFPSSPYGEGGYYVTFSHYVINFQWRFLLAPWVNVRSIVAANAGFVFHATLL